MLTSFDRRELAGNEHRRGNFNECKRLISVREVTLSELRDSIARLRERVKLVCRTRGSPPPRVHWLKDGIPLHPRRGLRIQHKRWVCSFFHFDFATRTMHPAKPKYSFLSRFTSFTKKKKKIKHKIRRILIERTRLTPRFACIRKIRRG